MRHARLYLAIAAAVVSVACNVSAAPPPSSPASPVSPLAPAQQQETSPGTQALPAGNPSPPAQPVRLVFVHHSTGENWLNDESGGLGIALQNNNYFVSDANYAWGPADQDVGDGAIGDHTDIGHWYSWFAGPHRTTYLNALYALADQNSWYSRLPIAPTGANQIIMFKSCFPNSNLGGQPSDPPTTGANPLRGQDSSSEYHTVGNAKGIYNDILAYFATRQDKLFVLITAPPLNSGETSTQAAANARALNNWLVDNWLAAYPYANVAVFDFYNVLTSNGGNRNTNDVGSATGNHHRWRDGAIQHTQSVASNVAAYGSTSDDSHPTAAGGQKATAEFVTLLNVLYNRWQAAAGPATPTRTTTRTLTRTSTRTPTRSATPTLTPVLASTPTRTRTRTPAGSVTPQRQYLPVIAVAWPAPPSLTPTRTSTPTSSGALCPGQQTVLVTDFTVRQPPAMAEPAARVPFRDPVYGSCVVRVTDRHADIDPDDPSQGMKNEYSLVQSSNADDSLIVVRGLNATWYLYNAVTLQPILELPFGGEVEPRWDAADPDVLYYNDDKRLMTYDVSAGEATLVHDFTADFPGQALAAVWGKNKGNPSIDGRYWGFMAENEDWLAVAFVVYDRQADRVIAKRQFSPSLNADPNDVGMSPLGTYLVVNFEVCEQGQLGTLAHPCGLMVYDRNLNGGRGLLRGPGHQDMALDAQGREVLVYQDVDTDHLSMLNLATGTVTDLWPIDFSHTSIGFHVSGRAFNRPGWVVVSTHDGDTASHTWMDDQVFLMELKPGGRVVHVAHTHSLVDENQEHDYWAESHGSANRAMTRLLFTSNWGRSGTEDVEMYLVALPQDWLAMLP